MRELYLIVGLTGPHSHFKVALYEAMCRDNMYSCQLYSCLAGHWAPEETPSKATASQYRLTFRELATLSIHTNCKCHRDAKAKSSNHAARVDNEISPKTGPHQQDCHGRWVLHSQQDPA